MECRPGCGACCIAPSISTLDKPAGQPCKHLDAELRCRHFRPPERPALLFRPAAFGGNVRGVDASRRCAGWPILKR
jgi:hypothetical protein